MTKAAKKRAKHRRAERSAGPAAGGAARGIGERLRALRLCWGFTQLDLAGRAKLGRSAIALLETNRNKGSSWQSRSGLAQAFGISLETFDAYLRGALSELEVVRASSSRPAPPVWLARAASSQLGRPAGTLRPTAWAAPEFKGLWASEAAPTPAGAGTAHSETTETAHGKAAGTAHSETTETAHGKAAGTAHSETTETAHAEAADTARAEATGTARAGSPRPPRRLSYATADRLDEIAQRPNLARAIALVIEHTGVESTAVRHSALALALAAESLADRSVLEWAQLLDRHVRRMGSGPRFNPRGLPELMAAMQECCALTAPSAVERAASAALRGEAEPRTLDKAAWLQRIEAQWLKLGLVDVPRASSFHGAEGSALKKGKR